jgi:hypothetical protein
LLRHFADWRAREDDYSAADELPTELRPYGITLLSNQVDHQVPTPPNRLVPPGTAAANDSSSSRPRCKRLNFDP